MSESTKTALIIIDLQKEFFCPDGLFGERCFHPDQIMPMVEMMTRSARKAGNPVYWIRSEYENKEKEPLRPPRGDKDISIPMNTEFLAKTHYGQKDCCRTGTPQAEFLDEVKELMWPTDHVITKTRYSAFMETRLHDELQRQGIKRVVIMGVVAQICVLASCCDAFFLDYDVTVVEEGVLSSNIKHFNKLMTLVEEHYGQSLHGHQIVQSWGIPAELRGLGQGDTRLLYNILPDELSKESFEAVRKEISWQTMCHRGGLAPRLVSIQGTMKDGFEPVYRHPVDEQPKLFSWTPMVEKVKGCVEEILGVELNHGLIQYYRHGLDYISDHSDKTLDILRKSEILNLSLGSTRTMILKSKEKFNGFHRYQRVRLPHGSLFCLGWETNRQWLHGIKQDKRPDYQKLLDELVCRGERISLTFRQIATFCNSEGKLFGQGAKSRTLEEADLIQASETEEVEMLRAFSKENHLSSDFVWDEYYGSGFQVINFKTLNTFEEETGRRVTDQPLEDGDKTESEHDPRLKSEQEGEDLTTSLVSSRKVD